MNAEGITLIVVTHDPAIGRRARTRMHMVDGAIVTADAAQAGVMTALDVRRVRRPRADGPPPADRRCRCSASPSASPRSCC